VETRGGENPRLLELGRRQGGNDTRATGGSFSGRIGGARVHSCVRVRPQGDYNGSQLGSTNKGHPCRRYLTAARLHQASDWAYEKSTIGAGDGGGSGKGKERWNLEVSRCRGPDYHPRDRVSKHHYHVKVEESGIITVERKTKERPVRPSLHRRLRDESLWPEFQVARILNSRQLRGARKGKD